MRVTFRGRGVVPDQTWLLRADAGQTASQSLRFRLPADVPAGRQMFTISPVDTTGAEVVDPFLAVDVASSK
jgi:hypothetical protein